MKVKLILCLALFLSGCGAVITGITVGIGLTSSKEATNNPPSLTITAPGANVEKNDLVTLSYRLIDAESNSSNILVEWSTDGVVWKGATELAGQTIDTASDGMIDLASSPSGTDHSFVWNTFVDIPAANKRGVKVRLTPTDTASGLQGQKAELTLDIVNLYTTTILGRTQPNSNEVPYFPESLFADPQNNQCYITNRRTNTLIALDMNTGLTSRIAGTGLTPFNGDDILGTLANLNQPTKMDIGYDRATGEQGFIFADSYNHRIRFINLTTKFISTIAGTGTPGYDEDFSGGSNAPLSSKLYSPYGVKTIVAPDMSGLDGYCFSEQGNRVIRFVNWSTHTYRFYKNIIEFNSTDITVTVNPSEIGTIAGNAFGNATFRDGPIWVKENPQFSTAGRFKKPGNLQFVRLSNTNPPTPALFVADDNRIRVVNLGTKTLSFFTNTSVAIDIKPGYVSTILNNPKFSTGQFLSDGALAPGAGSGVVGEVLVFGDPSGLYYTTSNLMFSENAKQSLWFIDGVTGQVGRFVGDERFGYGGDGGPPRKATLALPRGITFFPNLLVFADQYNNRIRAINFDTQPQVIAGKTIESNTIETIAQGPSQGTVALSTPIEIVPDSSTGEVYISDLGTNRILKINPTNRLNQVIAGTGKGATSGDGGLATSADIGNPTGLAFWSDGTSKLLLICDNGQSLGGIGPSTTGGRIRMVNLGTGDLTFGTVSALGAGNIDTLVGGGTIVTKKDLGNPGISNDLYDVAPDQVQLGEVLDVGLDTPEGTNLPGVYITEKATVGNAETYRLLVYNPNQTYSLHFNIGGLIGTRIVSPGKVCALAIQSADIAAGTAKPLELRYFNTPGRFHLRGGARNNVANTNLVAMVPLTKNHIVIGISYASGATLQNVAGQDIPNGEAIILAGVADKAGYNGDWRQATTAKLNHPAGVFYVPLNPPTDPNDVLVIADTNNHRIRVVFGSGIANPSMVGVIINYVGAGQPGYNGEILPPTNTHLNSPTHIVGFKVTNINGKAADVIFIADGGNSRIRRFCVEGD